MENGEIIRALAKKMRIALTPGGRQDIEKEIKKAVPLYGKLANGGFWGKDLLKKTFMTPNGKGRFALFDVDVTPYGGEKKCYLSDENYFSRQIRSRLVE
jgi:hypothetical protein